MFLNWFLLQICTYIFCNIIECHKTAGNALSDRRAVFLCVFHDDESMEFNMWLQTLMYTGNVNNGRQQYFTSSTGGLNSLT